MSRRERHFDHGLGVADAAIELGARASGDDEPRDDRLNDEPPQGDVPRDDEVRDGPLGGDLTNGDDELARDELRRDELALEEEPADLDLDDVVIDESAFPPLDSEDPDAAVDERAHEDLIDRSWLEREPGQEEDEPSTPDAFGLTIELDGPTAEDEGEVVDLDVGALLTSLPDAAELEPGVTLDRAALDRAEALGALRDVLLPETTEDDEGDHEVGNDDRFPAFDDSLTIRRPPANEDADDGREDES